MIKKTFIFRWEIWHTSDSDGVAQKQLLRRCCQPRSGGWARARCRGVERWLEGNHDFPVGFCGKRSQNSAAVRRGGKKRSQKSASVPPGRSPSKSVASPGSAARVWAAPLSRFVEGALFPWKAPRSRSRGLFTAPPRALCLPVRYVTAPASTLPRHTKKKQKNRSPLAAAPGTPKSLARRRS